MPALSFGSFVGFCQQAALPLCAFIPYASSPATTLAASSTSPPVDTICYAHNILFAGTFRLFQPAALMCLLVAITMALIMIRHTQMKYTAVGRKEFVILLNIYLFIVILEFLLLSDILSLLPPPSTTPSQYWIASTGWQALHPVVAALHVGLINAFTWCLFLNGFVVFQIFQDGTRHAVWFFRLSSLVVMIITGYIALATFLPISPSSPPASLSFLVPTSQTPLFSVYYVLPATFILLYLITQIGYLVTMVMPYRPVWWPLGELALGLAFFVMGQLTLALFSTKMCIVSLHYVDGIVFAVMASLFSVMMLYKYFDSITDEDLEFHLQTRRYDWKRDGDDDKTAVVATLVGAASTGVGGSRYTGVPGSHVGAGASSVVGSGVNGYPRLVPHVRDRPDLGPEIFSPRSTPQTKAADSIYPTRDLSTIL